MMIFLHLWIPKTNKMKSITIISLILIGTLVSCSKDTDVVPGDNQKDNTVSVGNGATDADNNSSVGNSNGNGNFGSVGFSSGNGSDEGTGNGSDDDTGESDCPTVDCNSLDGAPNGYLCFQASQVGEEFNGAGYEEDVLYNRSFSDGGYCITFYPGGVAAVNFDGGFFGNPGSFSTEWGILLNGTNGCEYAPWSTDPNDVYIIIDQDLSDIDLQYRLLPFNLESGQLQQGFEQLLIEVPFEDCGF